MREPLRRGSPPPSSASVAVRNVAMPAAERHLPPPLLLLLLPSLLLFSGLQGEARAAREGGGLDASSASRPGDNVPGEPPGAEPTGPGTELRRPVPTAGKRGGGGGGGQLLCLGRGADGKGRGVMNKSADCCHVSDRISLNRRAIIVLFFLMRDVTEGLKTLSSTL